MIPAFIFSCIGRGSLKFKAQSIKSKVESSYFNFLILLFSMTVFFVFRVLLSAFSFRLSAFSIQLSTLPIHLVINHGLVSENFGKSANIISCPPKVHFAVLTKLRRHQVMRGLNSVDLKTVREECN